MRIEHQSRILAMQALSQWEVQQQPSDGAVNELADVLEVPREAVRYAVTLLRGFWPNQKEIDRSIQNLLQNWDLSRLSPVERNILRLAVVELREGQTPPRVTIDEAVEIGKEYGGADSPKFINGVLDKLLKEMEGKA